MADKPIATGKRALDLIALLLLAPLVVPLGLLIALLVILDSPGSAIYRAARVGIGGTPFAMFKFRTMKCEAAGNSLASASDQRITPAGRLLRKTRLDELPQLWNVLRGEMSFVGPRPELEEFVAFHAEEYRQILSVLPGITGPTQLRFAGVEAKLLDLHEDPDGYYREHLLPDKVAMDLEYAQSRSLFRDFVLICETLALPIILALQHRRTEDAAASGAPLVYAGAVTLVLFLPLLFAIGLGSPR
ncbi:MAG TPA: sugar transferase [Solirubrobacterales bacterium]|nr:sugar transferase [Solirubrobacterales bacterium]